MSPLRAAGAGVLLAAPVAAQDGPPYAPCLVPRDGLGAYVQAFEAEGWTRAVGAARERALEAVSEARGFNAELPRSFEDEADLDAFLERAHYMGPRELTDAVVLTRGEVAAAVAVRPDPLGDGPTRVVCILAAPELEGVGALVALNGFTRVWDEPGATRGVDIFVGVNDLDPPEGASEATVNAFWVRLPVAPDRRLAGAQSMVTGLVLEDGP